MNSDESQRKSSPVKPDTTRPDASTPAQSPKHGEDAPPHKRLPFDTSDEEKATQQPDPQPGGNMFV